MIQTFWLYLILKGKQHFKICNYNMYIYLTFDLWRMFGYFNFIISLIYCERGGGISPKRTVLICFLFDKYFFAYWFCPGCFGGYESQKDSSKLFSFRQVFLCILILSRLQDHETVLDLMILIDFLKFMFLSFLDLNFHFIYSFMVHK